MLQSLLLAYANVLDHVAAQLRQIGLHPTTRLKTSGTIIDKLRRERSMGLRQIQDLAGARVVQPMTLTDQHRLADRVLTLWPQARVIDRRREPSFGYRSLHLVPRVDGCSVEIQLRTTYQNAWAQAMELLADSWGRQIRYGVSPDEPGRTGIGGRTRQEVIDWWIALSPSGNECRTR
jgi:ppGpp synthetase/RelA/SpoT-type nucleotidyltranferase